MCTQLREDELTLTNYRGDSLTLGVLISQEKVTNMASWERGDIKSSMRPNNHDSRQINQLKRIVSVPNEASCLALQNVSFDIINSYLHIS